MNSILDTLSPEEAFEFRETCIRILSNANQELSQYRSNKDWGNATKVAHKLLGSANLYASIKLQELLQNIEDGIFTGGDLEQAFVKVQEELTLVISTMKKAKIC